GRRHFGGEAQQDGVAVERRRELARLGRDGAGPVAAPEVDLVARVDDAAPRDAIGAGAERVEVLAGAGSRGRAADRRQQRRGGGAAGGGSLRYPGGGRGEIGAVRLRPRDEARQLLVAECPPPVRRRRLGLP